MNNGQIVPLQRKKCPSGVLFTRIVEVNNLQQIVPSIYEILE